MNSQAHEKSPQNPLSNGSPVGKAFLMNSIRDAKRPTFSRKPQPDFDRQSLGPAILAIASLIAMALV